MLDLVKDTLRRKKIRKFASRIPTGFIPLTDTSTVNVVVDVEDPGFDMLREEILAWGRRKGLKVCIYFLDFRKIGKDELLLTSINTTILKRELDWLGTPDLSKVMNLLGEQSDIFISLVGNGDFTIDFLGKCAKSRFKIGRYEYEGHPYDMVFTGEQAEDRQHGPLLIFRAITDFLDKVR
ncbi:MAG: hypothetical protein K2G18_10150 [Bacteroidales bacterium]|nr:hypothetical protein [Bacteroidales bacterium]